MIIPCHNEEHSIVQTILRAKENIDACDILVVDNLCTDKTVELALENGARVIHAPIAGKGWAVRQAISQMNFNYDLYLMIDGDDTYGMQQFEIAANKILTQGFAMVIGTRTKKHETNLGRGEVFRRGHATGNAYLSKMFTMIFGLKIDDTLSGWRLMSPGFLRSFPGGASGFEIEAELNAHAFLLECPVWNFPVSYEGRPDGSYSKLRTYKDGFKILKMYYRLFRAERPLLAYSILGGPWILGSIYLIRNVLETYFTKHLIPNFPSLIAGVGSFTVGSLLCATGLILDKVRTIRKSVARYRFIDS